MRPAFRAAFSRSRLRFEEPVIAAPGRQARHSIREVRRPTSVILSRRSAAKDPLRPARLLPLAGGSFVVYATQDDSKVLCRELGERSTQYSIREVRRHTSVIQSEPRALRL